MEMHPFAEDFVQSGKTRAVCSYNEQRRKIQKTALCDCAYLRARSLFLAPLHPRASRMQVKGARDGTDNAAPRAAARCL